MQAGDEAAPGRVGTVAAEPPEAGDKTPGDRITANLHLSGSGVAMPMVARVALGATMVTEQKRGG